MSGGGDQKPLPASNQLRHHVAQGTGLARPRRTPDERHIRLNRRAHGSTLGFVELLMRELERIMRYRDRTLAECPQCRIQVEGGVGGHALHHVDEPLVEKPRVHHQRVAAAAERNLPTALKGYRGVRHLG